MLRPRKTYTSCSELPLFNFIKIVLTNNLDYLYSERKTIFNTNSDQNDNWGNIFNEYNKLSNGKSAIHTLSLVREITFISNKLTLLSFIINYLKVEYSEDLIKILKEWGFKYKFSTETMPSDLKLTESSAKKMILKQMELTTDLDKLSTNDNVEVTEKDWLIVISQISKYMGFNIDQKKTSIAMFTTYIETFTKDHSSNGK